jgi:hypothetical protein
MDKTHIPHGHGRGEKPRLQDSPSYKQTRIQDTVQTVCP